MGRKNFKFSASAVILLICSSHALADWQFAKWGMSPADVEQAAKKAGIGLTKVAPMPNGAHFTRYTIPYSTRAFEFDAGFSFTAGKNPRLNAIGLEMRNTDINKCKALRSELKSAYGHPVGQVTEEMPMDFIIAKWRDADAKNAVTWIWEKQERNCRILYGDLKNGL